MSRASKQAGAALLTALIIVSLVATLAAAMVWRQYRAVQIESAERARAQAGWILQGALDWARLILREDARANQTSPVDHLGEVWAVPLAEARLSTFLAVEQARGEAAPDDGPEAFLSGTIEDAQSRYNLRRVLGGEQVPEAERRVVERLCDGAGAPPGTAARIVAGMRAAFPEQQSSVRDDQPLAPQDLDQLAWFGLDAATVERLRPLLIILPTATAVNLNTAPREVIAALFENMDLASAERLVQARQQAPLKQAQAAQPYLPEGTVISSERASVQSGYFIVSGRLRLDGRVLEDRSLVRRRGLEIAVLEHQRINRVLEP